MTIRPLTLTVAAAIVAASSLAACGGGSDDADAGTDTVAVTGTGAVSEGDPVATVSIPQAEIGVNAAEMLLELRAGRPLDQPHRLIATQLVVRRSTSAAR